MHNKRLQRKHESIIESSIEDVVSDPIPGLVRFAYEQIPSTIRWKEEEIRDNFVEFYADMKKSCWFEGVEENDYVEAACHATMRYIMINVQTLTARKQSKVYSEGSD